MSNVYGIPELDLDNIKIRDKACVYCHKKMTAHSLGDSRTNWATIEHFNIFPPWNNPTTVAICCWSCNSSRGKKLLRDWFKSKYCRENDINEESVADPVKLYISTTVK